MVIVMCSNVFKWLYIFSDLSNNSIQRLEDFDFTEVKYLDKL